MRSIFTKATAFVLSGALILSGNDVTSFAKGRQNLSKTIAVMNENVEESAGDPSGADSSLEEAEEQTGSGNTVTGTGESGVSGTDSTGTEDITETEGTSTEDTTETEGTSTEDTTETEGTSTEDTTETEGTSTEDATDTEETETEETSTSNPDEEVCAEIIDVELFDVDESNAVYQDSNDIYYTNKNELTVIVYVEKKSDKDIDLEITNEKNDANDNENNNPNDNENNNSNDDESNNPNDNESNDPNDDENNNPNDDENNNPNDNENNNDNAEDNESDNNNDNENNKIIRKCIINISNGLNEVTINVKIDNEIVDTKTLEIICDNDDPGMEIKHLAEDGNRVLFEESNESEPIILYTNNSSFQARLQVNDSTSGISTVQAKIDEKIIDLSKKNETTYIYEFHDIKSSQEIKYIVTDNAGNCVESPTYKVFLDNKEPEWLTKSEAIELNDNKTISVETKDEDGGSGIQKVYTCIKKNEIELKRADNDKYTFVLEEDLLNLLRNDKKDFVECDFFAEDKAGNKSSKKYNLLFDFTGPKINVKVYSGESVKNGSLIDKDLDSGKYYVMSTCTIKLDVEDIANGGLASGVNSIELTNAEEKENIEKQNSEITVHFGGNGKNENKQYTITAKDGTGNESTYKFEIVYDAEKPVIKINGPEDVLKKTYFNQEDIDKMSFSIEEKNFSKADVKIVSLEKEKIPTISNWENDTSAKLGFPEDGVYGFKIMCKDKAGNEGEVIVNQLVLDTKAPEVSIAYEQEIEDKAVYYNRSAKIIVKDENFSKKYTIMPENSACIVSKWEQEDSDNTYSCIVSYKKEGEYNFTFSCTDMAGNSKTINSRQIIIDQTVPVINVSFEGEEKVGDEIYYNKPRTALVMIAEQNFNSDNVEIEWSGSTTSSQYAKLGEWSTNGIEHTQSILFDKDGEYGFTIKCTDEAGNVGKSEKVESFVIDRKSPIIKVEYDNEKPQNEKYYNVNREVKVIVEDANFDEEYGIQLKLEPGTVEPKISKATQNGDVYTYVISMEENGEYKFSVGARDKAGNVTEKDCIDNTIIDRTFPEIKLELDKKDSVNGNYYKVQNATVIITEQNFDDTAVEIVWDDSVTTGSRPQLSAWSEENGKHTAIIQFTEDGVYDFKIRCTDLAGNNIESNMVGKFIIDKTNPTVDIEYDKESPVNGKYHNTFRTAKVIVTDANFDDTCVTKFDITSDSDKPRIGKWTKTKSDGSGGNQYTCEVFFATDGEYSFKFSCEDLAGNKSETEDGGSFIIDTTKPEISVTYDNNSVKNGKYYNNTRTATITVTDKSFKDDLVKVESLNTSGVSGLPAISGWTADGDKHTAKISFMEDGSYGFKVTCVDLADNAAKDYLGEIFIIDRTVPEIVFGGVRKNSANNGVVAPTLKCTDAFLDETGTQIILTGTNHGQLAGIAQKSVIKDGIQLVYPDFEHTQEMDDFYTLKVKAVDLAGNETEDELNFSVNRFGSTYRISTDTQRLVDDYYTGKAPVVTVTEINIDELEYGEVTISKDGQTVTLAQGSNYVVTKEGADEDWKSYTYSIKSGNFAKDGVYSVGFYSKDKASNTSDNRIKGKEIEFALDTTAPSIVADGIESGERYNEKTRDVTVDVKDNMFLTNLLVTDDGAAVLDMSEKELAENGGVVTFTLDEADKQRDIIITAQDKVDNVQKLEFHDVVITTKEDVIKEIEKNSTITTDNINGTVTPSASKGIVLPSYDEDNSLLYMVTEVMSAAVLITAVVVFYRKRRKRNI